MTDMLLTLFSDYGPKVLAWILALLAGLLARYVWQKVGYEFIRGVLERAYNEVTASVLEVSQVYADAIKAKRADGKLTDREKAEAKELAISKAKELIGAKGLAKLGRILGAGDAVDRWLSNKVEAAVRASKPSISSMTIEETHAAGSAPARPPLPA